MKKLATGVLLACLTMNSLFAVEIDMNTKVESVTIYHSGALVIRTETAELNPGVHELIFKNLSSKIILNSIKISNKEITILNKSIVRKLTKEEYNQLIDKKDALNKQMLLIESKYSEAGFVTKVEDLEKMTAFYSDKIMQVKKELREVEAKINDAKKLESIELQNENAAILKLIVSVEGKLKESFKIQYVCGGIGWSPAYEIAAGSSADKTIEIKYLAKTMSQTGEDWNNITINLSSSFPLESPTDLPAPESPWLIESRFDTKKAATPVEAKDQQTEQQQIARLEGVSYQEINIPSFLRLRTLKEKYSIKSNSTVFTFPVQTVTLPATYYFYGYPGIDPEVYLVARVTGWDTLGFIDGIANITFGGNEIGKSLISFSEFKDTLLLPVGKDNSVFMKRSEIADQKYFKITTVGKKRKNTLAYRYEIKNNNSFPVHFELVDQFPISQTKSAEVVMEKTSNGELDNEAGEITWQIDLSPRQDAVRELIFTIETDEHYRYSNGGKKYRYRTVSAPSF